MSDMGQNPLERLKGLHRGIFLDISLVPQSWKAIPNGRKIKMQVYFFLPKKHFLPHFPRLGFLKHPHLPF